VWLPFNLRNVNLLAWIPRATFGGQSVHVGMPVAGMETDLHNLSVKITLTALRRGSNAFSREHDGPRVVIWLEVYAFL